MNGILFHIFEIIFEFLGDIYYVIYFIMIIFIEAYYHINDQLVVNARQIMVYFKFNILSIDHWVIQAKSNVNIEHIKLSL